MLSSKPSRAAESPSISHSFSYNVKRLKGYEYSCKALWPGGPVSSYTFPMKSKPYDKGKGIDQKFLRKQLCESLFQISEQHL